MFCSRHCTHVSRVSEQPVSPAPSVRASRRPASGDRQADRRHRGRARLPDAARRYRFRQDVHNGQRDRPHGTAGDRDGAQQDPCCPVVLGIPRVPPRERDRVLRQLLRLLPARGVRPVARPVHRKRLVDQRAHRADAAVGDQVTARAARRGDRRHGVGDLWHRRPVRLSQHGADAAAGRQDVAARRHQAADRNAV